MFPRAASRPTREGRTSLFCFGVCVLRVRLRVRVRVRVHGQRFALQRVSELQDQLESATVLVKKQRTYVMDSAPIPYTHAGYK